MRKIHKYLTIFINILDILEKKFVTHICELPTKLKTNTLNRNFAFKLHKQIQCIFKYLN